MQATQLVELDREVATGLRKLNEDLSRFGQEIKDSSHEGEEIKDSSREGEEIKDLSREEIKAEEIDTRGNNDQESKKENPDE